MVSVLTVLVIIIFLMLSIIHIYWAFGGSLGVNKTITEISEKAIFKPGKYATLLVALTLFIFSAVAYLLTFYELNSVWYANYIVNFGWIITTVLVLGIAYFIVTYSV